MTAFKPLETKDDLRAYALSVLIPFLEKTPQTWRGKGPAGKPHWLGEWCSYLEGICRPLWGLAPLLAGYEKPVSIRYKGETISLEQWYHSAILSGVSENSPHKWPHNKELGQTATEAAALGIGFVLAPQRLWGIFTAAEQNSILKWLYRVGSWVPQDRYTNNHYWFTAFINLCLKKLGYRYHEDCLTKCLAGLDNLYLGQGWYRDGAPRRFDHYLAWAHHFYPLLWLLLAGEENREFQLIKEKYAKRAGHFFRFYPYFFDKNGLYAFWGRSLAYRYAAVAAFPLACHLGLDISPGIAKHLTLANIDYFRQHGAEDGKIIEPGFSYATPLVTERYISASSSYWCGKAFFALLLPDNHPFWTSPAEPLPIEREGKYLIKFDIDEVELKVQADNERGGVTVYNGCLENPGRYNSTRELYGKFVYNSRSGFGVSTRDLAALDSMISLEKEELSSHRGNFCTYGWKNAVHYSSHIPFINDPDTCIHTALLPLAGGWHLRAHQVNLKSPYRVSEGGFALGNNSAAFKTFKLYPTLCEDTGFEPTFTSQVMSQFTTESAPGLALQTEIGTSMIYCYGARTLELTVRMLQPGAHLLYAHAVYPAYQTTDELPAGRYLFVSGFALTTQEEFSQLLQAQPEIALGNTTLHVTQNGLSTVIVWEFCSR